MNILYTISVHEYMEYGLLTICSHRGALTSHQWVRCDEGKTWNCDRVGIAACGNLQLLKSLWLTRCRGKWAASSQHLFAWPSSRNRKSPPSEPFATSAPATRTNRQNWLTSDLTIRDTRKSKTTVASETDEERGFRCTWVIDSWQMLRRLPRIEP